MSDNIIPTEGSTICLDLGELNPKQKLFCQAKTRYIAYGGARGGGKDYVLRVKAIMGALAYPGIRILFIRCDSPDLEQAVILPMRQLIPVELAVYNKSMRMFVFANGSIIKFGPHDETDDLTYPGQEYDWIFLGEATQHTEDQFRSLCAHLRGASSFPKRMYLSATPGGVGDVWVKTAVYYKSLPRNGAGGGLHLYFR